MERSPLVNIDHLLHTLAHHPITVAEVPFIEQATHHFTAANSELANKASELWLLLSEREDYLACLGTLLQHTHDPLTKTMAYHSLRSHIDSRWEAIGSEHRRELITHLVASTQEALQTNSQHPEQQKLLHALNASLAAILKHEQATLIPEFVRQLEVDCLGKEPPFTANSLKVINLLIVEAFNS